MAAISVLTSACSHSCIGDDTMTNCYMYYHSTEHTVYWLPSMMFRLGMWMWELVLTTGENV